MLLEERGKLSVDDPVKKYLPDAPTAWDKITIFNLLTHTSGIPEFAAFPDYKSLEPFPSTPEKLVARFRDKPLDFQPGEKCSYSNSGYILLGYLIEQISGETYGKFVEDNIFTPLGMKDSGYDSNSAIIPRRAAGYSPSEGGPVNADFVHMTVPFASGGLYSTTEDLLRWEQGLFGGKLLSPASVKKMTTPFKDDYGFGLLVQLVNGHLAFNHAGLIEGFRTTMAYYPDDKLTVIVLGNLMDIAPLEIASKLGALAFGEKVVMTSDRRQVKVDPRLFDGYLGQYQLPAFVLIVTREGDRLFVQEAGQPKIEIFPQSERDYFLKGFDAQITFETDSQGRASELILHQMGVDQLAKRIE